MWLPDTSLNSFPYRHFTDDSLWTSFHTGMSPMTASNIFIYTYFNDDYFEYIYVYASTMTALNIFTSTYFNDVSMWTILHAPVSRIIHVEHRCRYNEESSTPLWKFPFMVCCCNLCMHTLVCAGICVCVHALGIVPVDKILQWIHCWVYHSSGAVWESRWPSWAVRPNEPSGFRRRKSILNHASALVSDCP